jgi:hypothetical protein
METFLGMEVEQPGKVIRLHLDSYIQEVLTEYKAYIKKAPHIKEALVQSGLPNLSRSAQAEVLPVVYR